MNPIETFFLTECIFKYYLAFSPLFVVAKLYIGGNCTSTPFTSFVFLCNLDFCFRKLWSLVWVSMCDIFGSAEVPRIKSALQSHRLICWTLFLSSSDSRWTRSSSPKFYWSDWHIESLQRFYPKSHLPAKLEVTPGVFGLFFFLLCAESGFKWKNYQN